MAPRVPRPFVVFAFRTTHEALSAETVLKDAGLSVVPIATPPVLGELCGISMRLPPEQRSDAEEALRRGGVDPEATAIVEDV